MEKLIVSLFKSLLSIFMICMAGLLIVSLMQLITDSVLAIVIGIILAIMFICFTIYFYYNDEC